MPEEEVEIEVCCDALSDAIEGGGIQIVEVRPGVYTKVVPDRDGVTGIQINYCPFCGEKHIAYDESEIEGGNSAGQKG